VTETIQTLLLLLAVLVVVAIVARRLNTAPSILLVIAGIGVASDFPGNDCLQSIASRGTAYLKGIVYFSGA
jgi:Kef-type K+ transport system membrane component KefB